MTYNMFMKIYQYRDEIYNTITVFSFISFLILILTKAHI